MGAVNTCPRESRSMPRSLYICPCLLLLGIMTTGCDLNDVANALVESSIDARCEEMCSFKYECGDVVGNCLRKCTVNSKHSLACRDIYDELIDCAQKFEQTCSGFDTCVAVHDLDWKYKRSDCPE